MPFSKALKQDIEAWWKGSNTTDAPSSVYVALLTTNPTADDGTGLVEVVAGSGANQWNGYARKSAAFGSTSSSGGTPDTESITNSSAVDFGNTNISSGTITIVGFALYSAASAGTFLGWASISSTVLNSGVDVQFGASSLTVSTV